MRVWPRMNNRYPGLAYWTLRVGVNQAHTVA